MRFHFSEREKAAQSLQSYLRLGVIKEGDKHDVIPYEMRHLLIKSNNSINYEVVIPKKFQDDILFRAWPRVTIKVPRRQF